MEEGVQLIQGYMFWAVVNEYVVFSCYNLTYLFATIHRCIFLYSVTRVTKYYQDGYIYMFVGTVYTRSILFVPYWSSFATDALVLQW